MSRDPSKKTKVFSQRLKARRKELKLSAFDLGLSPGHVNLLEQGEVFPRLHTLAKLSEALRCPIDYLTGKIDEITPAFEGQKPEENFSEKDESIVDWRPI